MKPLRYDTSPTSSKLIILLTLNSIAIFPSRELKFFTPEADIRFGGKVISES